MVVVVEVVVEVCSDSVVLRAVIVVNSSSCGRNSGEQPSRTVCFQKTGMLTRYVLDKCHNDVDNDYCNEYDEDDDDDDDNDDCIAAAACDYYLYCFCCYCYYFFGYNYYYLSTLTHVYPLPSPLLHHFLATLIPSPQFLIFIHQPICLLTLLSCGSISAS